MKRNALLAVFLCSVALPSLAAAETFRFVTQASAEQEVTGNPPVPAGIESDTSAKLVVKFRRDLSEARFRLEVFEGFDILQAHLHCAPAGSNGPIAAFLFDASGTNDPGFLGAALPGDGVDVDGVLEIGELENDDILPVECGGTPLNNIASLRAAMKKHLIYLNVHSIENRAGEVRGQLEAKAKRDRDDDDDDDD